MRYSRQPEDGQYITLGDLEEFVAEMLGYRQLPRDVPIRSMSVLEFDIRDGARVMRITADADGIVPVRKDVDVPPQS